MVIKSSFSKDVFTGKGNFLKFTSYLVFLLIFLDDVLGDMICLVNTDTMFNLDDVDIWDIKFCLFLEGIIKQSIKLFDQSFKENLILCCHEYIICFNCKKIFICLVNPCEDSAVR